MIKLVGDRSLYLSQIQLLLSQSGLFHFIRNEFKSATVNIEFIKSLYHLVDMDNSTWLEVIIDDFTKKPEIEFKLFIADKCELHVIRRMSHNIDLVKFMKDLIVEIEGLVKMEKRNNKIDRIINYDRE